ncbi:MAG: hypothetical protein M3256_09680 [Actinomycetota bacterium]|nr:hypothetical protein [Actinomycetota bacterium]
MSSGGGLASRVDRDELIRCSEVYDTAVGIVSAFHTLFTTQRDLAPTVAHFERYPNLAHSDGKPATPDFTVLFNDGSALVGEIANVTLVDQGVDRLCSQILRYDSLTEVPTGTGAGVTPTWVDVLLFVNVGTGTAAVHRIIDDRLANSDHPYKPSVPPCIVTAIPGSSGYTFMRQGDAANGRLREGERQGIGDWMMKGDITVPADYLVDNKAEWVFMNDSIDPLYLATHLWTREFATKAASQPRMGSVVHLVVNCGDLATELKAKYGKGSRSEVEHAMELLGRGKFATRCDGANWEVAWGEFTYTDDDLRGAIATRAAKPPGEGTLGRLRRAQREIKKAATAQTLF